MRRSGTGSRSGLAAVAIVLIAGTTIVVTAISVLYGIVITALAVVARTLIKTAGEVRASRPPALPAAPRYPPVAADHPRRQPTLVEPASASACGCPSCGRPLG